MTEGQVYTFNIEQGGDRLDRVLASYLTHLSRAHIQRLIKKGECTVNQLPSRKPSHQLENGDVVSLHIPPAEPQELIAERIPLEIVYQDETVVVVNKPAGMVVHPAAGHESGTLVNALLYAFPQLALVGGVRRPGIVHRLDKDTSGLVAVALTETSRLAIKAQFQERTVHKTYLALTDGVVHPPEGIIDAPIGRSKHRRKRMAVIQDGRDAQTHYHTLESFDQHTLVEAHPVTGRTHQIRVHFQFLGYPLVGDNVYGRRKATLPLKRQFLHAYQLSFTLPDSGRRLDFTAPLPNDLKHVLRLLKSDFLSR